MYFLSKAQAALEKTRELLKPSLKSGNKSYAYSALFTGMRLDKWNRRNDNQVQVNTALQTGPVVPIEGMSVLKAGEALYTRAVSDQATWYGNCAEQALIALYLCFQHGALPEELFLITYKKGLFEHSLVQLAVRGDYPKGASCDPWLNIACYHDEYKDKADAKLREWTGEGKRLPYGETGPWPFNKPNWVEPSNDLILGFAAGRPLDSVKATDRPRTGR